MKICIVKNCNRQMRAKDLCSNHYNQLQRYGRIASGKPQPHRLVNRKCKIKGCKREHRSKGYCHKHYSCYARTGNPYPKMIQLPQPEICKVRNCNRKPKAKGYCCKHYERWKKWKNPYFVKPLRGFNKGSANVNWKGGVAEYPNHAFMKKQRLVILMQNPKCEKCGKPAIEIHHRNGNKADHRLRNLMASCRRCNSRIHFKPSDSKYRRLYGMNLKELGKEFGLSEGRIWQRLNNRLISRKLKRQTLNQIKELQAKKVEV